MTAKKKLTFTLWALCITFIAPQSIYASSISAPLPSTPLLDSIVAVVDEAIILKSELSSEIKRFYKLNRNRNQTVPPADVVRRQVLERMIAEQAQLELAKRIGIKTSDSMVNTAIERLANQNKLSLVDYRSKLEQEFGNYQNARESIRTQITLSQLRERQIAQSITITDDEVDFFLEQNTKEADQRQFLLRHILIELPNQPSESDSTKASQLLDDIMAKLDKGADFAKIAITYSSGPTALNGGILNWRPKNELPTLLGDHTNSLTKGAIVPPIRTPGGYHIFKVEDIKGGPTALITKYTVQHILIKPSIVRDEQASRTLAEELQKKVLKNPNSFNEIAQTYSDDPASAKEGGIMEDIQANQLEDAFREMMVNSPTDTISPVFKTQYGWHFLRVINKKREDVGSILARQEAKQALYRGKFEEKLVPWIRKVRQEAYVEIML